LSISLICKEGGKTDSDEKEKEIKEDKNNKEEDKNNKEERKKGFPQPIDFINEKNQRDKFFKNLISHSKPLGKRNKLDIYLYPQIEFSYDEEIKAMSLIVLGQTGSGKTTLLNSLINFLLGVKQSDTFRFELIHEVTGQSQAHSQTSEVTLYKIKSYGKFPALNIIDTPGFGDTRGIQYDKKIFEMIFNFFNEKLDTINSICFVAQSSNSRLTINQKYIFSKIYELFGHDIAENFVCYAYLL